jgi:hypothetical protein
VRSCLRWARTHSSRLEKKQSLAPILSGVATSKKRRRVNQGIGCQVACGLVGSDFHILPDVTSFGEDDFGCASDPVLLLFSHDQSVGIVLTTAAAVVSAYLFAVGVYGGSDLVTNRLTELADTGESIGVTWLNEKDHTSSVPAWP